MPTLATSPVGKADFTTKDNTAAGCAELSRGRETVETVTMRRSSIYTQLKLGVNDKLILTRCVALIAFLITPVLWAQKLDQNANGMSDVWEQIYGASGFNPNADNDGDGASNAQEALAGTN